MYVQNGIKKFTSVPRTTPSKPNKQQFISINKEEYDHLTQFKYNRSVVITMNEEREAHLKLEIKKLEDKNSKLDAQLKKSEELRIRHEERIANLETKNKDLNRFCKTEQEKRRAKEKEYDEAYAWSVHCTQTNDKLKDENAKLQEELSRITDAFTQLKDHFDRLNNDRELRFKAELELCNRLTKRNNELKELKTRRQQEIIELRESIGREYEIRLSHEQARVDSLRAKLVSKTDEVERLIVELSCLRKDSNPQEPGNPQKFPKFFSNTDRMHSFGELAATPTNSRKRPVAFASYSDESPSKYRQSETPQFLPTSTFRAIALSHNRPSSWTTNKDSAKRVRQFDFELTDDESTPGDHSTKMDLIDLTINNETLKEEQDKSAEKDETNSTEQLDSTSKKDTTQVEDANKNLESPSIPPDELPLENFDDIYEVVNHTESIILQQAQTEEVANITEQHCQYIEKPVDAEQNLPPPVSKIFQLSPKLEAFNAECNRLQEISTNVLLELDEQQLERSLEHLPENLDISAEEEHQLLYKD